MMKIRMLILFAVIAPMLGCGRKVSESGSNVINWRESGSYESGQYHGVWMPEGKDHLPAQNKRMLVLQTVPYPDGVSGTAELKADDGSVSKGSWQATHDRLNMKWDGSAGSFDGEYKLVTHAALGDHQPAYRSLQPVGRIGDEVFVSYD